MLLLAVMIIVHELGHYWAAVAVGIRVDTFSIGFGPRLFGFKRGHTDFRVSMVPLGGYVRMHGDQPGDEHALDPDSFQAKARWQRAIVIMAGPLMNIVLAVLILTGLFMYRFEKEDDSGPSVITEIEPNSAAAQAGLQVGDRILQFAGKANPKWEYLFKEAMVNGNHPLEIVVQRNSKTLNLTVTPQLDPKEGVGIIGWGYGNIQITALEPNEPAQKAGIQLGDIILGINGKQVQTRNSVKDIIGASGGKPIDLEVRRAGLPLHFTVTPVKISDARYRIGVVYGEVAPFPIKVVQLPFAEAFSQSLTVNRDNAMFLFATLRGILQRRVSAKTMSGPVGIAKASAEEFHRGPWDYLNFMSEVSLSLAIFNLLPIPILDGGTLLLLFIEMLLQREVSMQVKETALKLGLVFLMMLVIFVFYNDIARLHPA